MSDIRISPISNANLPVRVQRQERIVEHPSIEYRSIKNSINWNREEMNEASRQGKDTVKHIIERTNARLAIMKADLRKKLVELAKKA